MDKLMKTLNSKKVLIKKKCLLHTAETVKSYNTTEIETQLQLLEEAIKIYNDTHEVITLSLEDSEQDDHINEFESVSALYVKVKSILLSEIRTRRHEVVIEKMDQHQQHVKLPPINIPQFSGKLEEWYAFKDQFESIVHNNDSVTDTQKMYYLKTSIIGDAAQIISSLSSEGNNYAEAWALIKGRYDNKHLVFQTHMYKLFAQPVAQGESAHVLKGLIDNTNKHVRALKNMKRPVDKWDDILVHLVSTRLPVDLRKIWEIESASSQEFPSWKMLSEFVESRIHALEVMQFRQGSHNSKPKQNKIITHATITNNKNHRTCQICNQSHNIYQCSTFMSSSAEDRLLMVKKAQICFNCLRPGHMKPQCTMDKGCKICGAKHHTLLHLNSSQVKPQSDSALTSVINLTKETSIPQETSDRTGTVFTHHGTSTLATGMSSVLLSTVLVKAHGPNGQIELCRALLDSASQSHFITTSLVKRLGLKTNKCSVTVEGISSVTTQISELTSFRISSRCTNTSYSMTALVSPIITVKLPTEEIKIKNWSHLSNVSLADPNFHSPGKIDLLIGADIFMDSIKEGKLRIYNYPLLQNTEFGWVVSGRLPSNASHMSASQNSTSATNVVTYCSNVTVDKILQQFWELEEIPRITTMSADELNCENHYAATHSRDTSGRFILRLPFRKLPPVTNNSYTLAVQRLHKVERFLSKNPDIAILYRNFMHDYELSNHMERVTSNSNLQPVVFIPHHHICRPTSTTTKLRVVFDGSCVMDSGLSLNDYLHTGPKLQRDVVSILINFRLARYVFTADIKQMFRQMLISPEDRVYQCILWRENSLEQPKAYTLNTVTYGLATSPYQAIRTLHQLADDVSVNHPAASKVILKNFYVDEVMTGLESLEELSSLQKELIHVLSQGGFELRKWASNSSTILENIPIEHRVSQLPLLDQSDAPVNVLGISWNAAKDTFAIQVNPAETTEQVTVTKRTLLSNVARVYDPCGWLSPLIVVSKLIIQQLWKEKLNWDEHVSEELTQRWISHRASFECLTEFDIPRCVNQSSSPVTTYALHGFCDSSERAYAAVVYLLATSQDKTTSTLLTSKTRVAPLKQISIPRLELCGALVLAQLTNSIIKSLSIDLNSINLWSDSTITLHWVQSEPYRWATFVANRITQIQQLVPTATWRHVSSSDNPADVASRGLTGEQLIKCQLWWQGPWWLSDNTCWPETVNIPSSTSLPEERVMQTVTITNLVNNDLLMKYSEFERLLRITSYILRFSNNCKTSFEHRRRGPVSVVERRTALLTWLRHAQNDKFSDEIQCLSKQNNIRTSSSLISLNPFVDESGLLRVGGRLKHADLLYTQKHPIILPKDHILTLLIIRQVHEVNLHASLNVTITLLRSKYWIIHGRSTIKRILHQCVTCFRYRKSNCQQIMGDLPASRVNISNPFNKCGVDYAGPFLTRLSKGRVRTHIKSYLALFICLVTKAVHLETVSDLTSDAFIAALRRFVSRRGYPSLIMSDNGTNFAGAHNNLRDLHTFLSSSTLSNKIHSFCLPHEIEWKFIPPASPHVGGIWEANVKSCKSILVRITKTTVYTFEELCTLFHQIEAILNSRPISALSTDPEDYSILTPGHFLIGRPLVALPGADFTDANINRLTRWNLVQRQQQQFWRQWSIDYISTLQQRAKWRTTQPNLQTGDLVLVKDDHAPPSQWLLARVTAVHPNPDDGHVRVVTIQTKQSSFKRPIAKLVRLPIDP